MTSANADKTHCPSGHTYTEENTFLRRSRNGRGCRICRRVQGAISRRKNVATKKKYDAQRYIVSGEEMKAAHREWVKANPDKVRNIHASRRARKANLFVEVVEREVVFERDQGQCGICQEAVDSTNWHLDHIVPLAKGGEHSYANTQVAHPACNIKKGGACELQ